MPASATGGKQAPSGQPWGSDVDEEGAEASAIPLKGPAASKAAALVPGSITTSSSSSSSKRHFISTDADSLMRTFQLRKSFQLNDKVKAYVGASYDLQQKTFSPVGAITYEVTEGVVAELTDSKATLSKRWVLGNDDRFAMHLKAECRLQLRDLPGVQRNLQPALHLSCERISPLPYQLLAIGLVLAGNLPLHLKNQDIKLPQLPGVSRLGLFGRLTLQRQGYTKAKLSLWEASSVLTV